MEDVHVLMQGLTKWNSAKVSDIMRTLRHTQSASMSKLHARAVCEDASLLLSRLTDWDMTEQGRRGARSRSCPKASRCFTRPRSWPGQEHIGTTVTDHTTQRRVCSCVRGVQQVSG
jgi:hypothetical protein